MDIKKTITERSVNALIKQERRKIHTGNVDTNKQRQEAIRNQRSLLRYYLLLKKDVVLAFAHAQAIVDLRNLRHPDDGCLYLSGMTARFIYDSPQARAKRELDKQLEQDDKALV